MTIRETVRSWFYNLLDLNVTDSVTRERMERLADLRDYYDGTHRKQLRVKPGKFDDNLTTNLVQLIIDKSVSALVGDPSDGHGLTWTFPSEEGEGTPKQIEWLNGIWEANQREIFLHKNALQGAESGIPAIKIVPDGAGNFHLVNINPLLLTVNVDEQDADKVTSYEIRYIVTENKKQVVYKEVTAPNGLTWTVETFIQRGGNSLTAAGPAVLWNYPFPPILVWQNLPAMDSPYGRSDVEGILRLQDRLNFVVSNISKIVRLYAHPNRYGRNITAQLEGGEIKMGPDDMPLFQGEGEIVQMPPVSDLPAAMEFEKDLRQLMFTIAREVDVSVFKDQVGAITNMGLRMMYKDTLEKLGTKRMLYGAAYQELNRRLLALNGYEPETCIINWPDPLPVNEVEEIAGLEADMRMQIVSRQTAQEARGYDPEQETERMSSEKATGDNAGAVLLRDFFNRGKPQGEQNG